MKKNSAGILVMLALCLIVAAVAVADEKAKPMEMQAPVTKLKPMDRATVPTPTTDLRVDSITSIKCYNLEGLDALYVSDIRVFVSRKGTSTPAALTVNYVDLSAGPQTIHTEVPSLNEYSTGVDVLRHPALIKKSMGIKAEITPNGIVKDSNPANNMTSINDCSFETVQ